MHLAVFAQHGAVGVDDGGGIVVEARAALFEEGDDDDHTEFLGQRGKTIGGGAGDGLGEIKKLRVLSDAEVGGVEKLLEADDLRATRGGITDKPLMLLHAFFLA